RPCWEGWGGGGRLLGSTPGRRVGAAAVLFLAGTLAVGTNPVSLVALLGVLALETLHAQGRPVRVAGPGVALGLAALAEAQIRRWYNAYCHRVYGEGFVTRLKLD